MMRRLLPLGIVSVALLGPMAFSFEHHSSEERQGGEGQRERGGEELASSLEQWIRGGFEFVWQGGQPMPDEVRQVWGKLGREGTGYGFRTFEAREDSGESNPDPAAAALVANMEYWRVTLDELHTSVVEGIGLVWGVYIEEFKANEQPPETVRVRFTNTLRWDGERWQNLLYHRDAQLFGEDGRYLVRR